MSKERGAKYEGAPCNIDGTTTKYVMSDKCVECGRRHNRNHSTAHAIAKTPARVEWETRVQQSLPAVDPTRPVAAPAGRVSDICATALDKFLYGPRHPEAPAVPAYLLRGLCVVAIAAAVVGCATNPRPVANQHRIEVVQAAAERDVVWEQRISGQTDTPDMINYLRTVCAQPQPDKARLANELIRTHKLYLYDAFDQTNTVDTAALEQAGTAVHIPCPPAAGSSGAAH